MPTDQIPSLAPRLQDALPSIPMASHSPAADAASAPASDAITVELSNGSRVEFPASMPPEQIQATVGQIETRIVQPSAALERVGAPLPSHAASQPSLMDRAIPMAMRVGGTVSGATVGTLLDPLLGPFGTIGGGAVGSGLGETAAERYEQIRGLRPSLNPAQIAVQTALGAIPLGRAVGTTAAEIAAYRALQGGAMGGAATVASGLADNGQVPSVGDIARGAGLGLAFGAAGGGLEGVARGARPAPVEPVRVGQVVDVPNIGRAAVVSLNADGTVDVTNGVRRWTFNANVLRPAVESPSLAAGARFVGTPEGQIAPAGADLPAQSDRSFVRSVPAQYAQREISGMLPAGREPIITAPPAGSVPDTTDQSFVRGIPAEFARRDVRGELGPGPRFIASDQVVAPAESAAQLPVSGDQGMAPPQAGESFVRGVRPAVLDYNIDPTMPAREGVTVRQFSSDVHAQDAPVLTDREQQMLQLMREDLNTFAPQRGRIIRPEGAISESDSVYAPGVAGSPVADDVRVISGQHVGNSQVAQAIDDLLAGKAPSNRLHTAVLDAARGYLEGRSGYRGPILPLEAVQPGGLSHAAAQEAMTGGGGAAPAINDFEAFSRMFDEVHPSPGGEPGESGSIAPRLALHLGGAAAGAVAGATTGDTPQQRIQNAIVGGLAGAAVPALLPRGAGEPSNAPLREQPVSGVRGVVSASGRAGAAIENPTAGFEPLLSKFSNPLVRDGVASMIADNAGFTAQRRGVVNNRALGQFANEVRVSAARVLPKGTALNAEQITATARALQSSVQKVNEIAALVTSGKATDADLLALQAAKAQADTIGKSLVGARAEAGRALAAFNFYRGILDTGDVNLIQNTLKAPGLREEAQRLADGLKALPDDPVVRYRWLQQQGGSTLWDKARSYYYANILSGVKTHERNFLGNLANTATGLITHPFGVAADAARSAATGAPRTMFLSELPAQTVGMLAGVDKGFRDALFTARHGVSPDALSRSVGTAAAAGKLDIPSVEFAGGGLNPFNWPTRALNSADVFFRSAARNRELYGLAFAQAKREGLTGAAFDNRVADLRAGLTPEGQQIQQEAATFAQREVFQEKPGKFASWLASGNQVPGLRYVMPFILPFTKTPANIMRQGFEFSPAGLLMKAARQEGRVGAQAQGRALAGTMAAGYLAYLAATGQISGNGPTDPAERASLMERGWRPNSVHLGDKWVSYQLFQPISVQASLIANAYDAWRDRGGKVQDAPDVIAQTLARTTNSFLDQSFLSGMFNFAQAINDPQRSASRVVASTASGLVPFSGAVRNVQQAADATVRSPRGILQSVEAGLPGLSQRVPARIDRFGRQVTREGSTAQRAIDPFNTSTESTDPVATELDRLDVPLTPPAGRLIVKGEPITRDESNELKQRQGQAVYRSLSTLIAGRRYQNATEDAQRQMIERSIDAARRAANEQFRREVIGRRRLAGAVPGAMVGRGGAVVGAPSAAGR